ncbi:MAG: hypothetical protein IPI31_10960 [Bacteroidetes bacterium]|nr:hypothetical protein [Bacteroidota bacterium]
MLIYNLYPIFTFLYADEKNHIYNPSDHNRINNLCSTSYAGECQQKAQKYLDEGVQRAMAKYLDKAVESFTNATIEEPNFVTAWIYLGDAYRNLKK